MYKRVDRRVALARRHQRVRKDVFRNRRTSEDVCVSQPCPYIRSDNRRYSRPYSGVGVFSGGLRSGRRRGMAGNIAAAEEVGRVAAERAHGEGDSPRSYSIAAETCTMEE